MTSAVTRWLGRSLANPVVDKTLAVITVAPIAYAIYLRLRRGELDIVRINLILQGVLNVIPMLLRRPASRVTLNPLLLAADLRGHVLGGLSRARQFSPGSVIVPRWLTVLLSCLGLAVAVYARLSLGRNIGVVPAQRSWS